MARTKKHKKTKFISRKAKKSLKAMVLNILVAALLIALLVIAGMVTAFLLWDSGVRSVKAASASSGSLNIQVIPPAVTPVTINGNQTITNPNGTLVVAVSPGVQQVVFGASPRFGLIAPAPPMPPTALSQFSNVSPLPAARQVFVGAGESQTIVGRYFQPADLKPIHKSETEILEYDPARALRGNASPRWGLLKGVASVSVDDRAAAEGIATTAHWQYSAAEILFIGAEEYIVDVEKTDGKAFMVVGAGGATNDYTIDFNAVAGPPSSYNAAVIDTVSVIAPTGVDAAQELNKIRITTAPGGVINSQHQVSFALANIIKGVPRTLRVGIQISAPLAPGTTIVNTADLSIENGAYTETVVDETRILAPFVKETAGGNVFARGGVRLTNPNTINRNNVLYTVGSSGAADVVSASGWVVNGYELRHDGQLINYDPATKNEQTNCRDDQINNAVRESGWCLMQTNIERLIKGARVKATSGFDGNMNPDNIAEGGSLHYTRGLTVSPGANLNLRGKGTVVVDGDMVINSNMQYSDQGIAGFIVRNGNVIIGPNVTEVHGIFYIFADQNVPNKGRLIVESRATADPSAYDSQFILKGSVVASGSYSSATRSRINAFELKRNYAGDLSQIESGAISPEKGNIPPAEDFQYDARVISTPPPGFTRDVFRGRQ